MRLLIGLLFFSISLPCHGKRTSARSVMEHLIDANRKEKASLYVTMVLLDARGGKRSRKVRMVSRSDKNLTSSILHITAPKQLSGTKVLTIEKASPHSLSRYIYLPALKATKRIQSHRSSQPFAGSDFSYVDLSNIILKDHDFSYLEGASQKGVWVIRALPKKPEVIERSGYRERVYYIDKKKNVVKKIVGKGAFMGVEKVFEAKNFENIGGYHTAFLWVMKRREDKKLTHTSLIKVHKVSYDTAPPKEAFSQRALKGGFGY